VRAFRSDGSVSWTAEIVYDGAIINDAIFGKTDSNITLVGTQKGASGGFSGIIVIKLGLDGKIVWKREVDGTSIDEPRAIFVNSQEDIYIAGQRAVSPFVMKL